MYFSTYTITFEPCIWEVFTLLLLYIKTGRPREIEELDLPQAKTQVACNHAAAATRGYLDPEVRASALPLVKYSGAQFPPP